MTATELRREIKKAVDNLPQDRLTSLADYVHFLSRPSLAQRIEKAEQEFASGNGANWRKVRSDV